MRKARTEVTGYDRAVRDLRTGLLSLAGLQTAREIIAQADAYKNLQGRLALVTKGQAAQAEISDRLFGIAQRTRQGLEATVDLYANLARSTKALNPAQTSLLQVTETVSQALIVSGASAMSAEASLRQLGQAFGSGALRGDELNAIMENTPRIAQAIADGMGITMGQLRKFGSEGKLTGAAVFNALQSQKAVIEKEFATMPLTVAQSITQAKNAMMKAIGEFDSASGLTSGIAAGIGVLTQNFDVLAKAVLAVAAAYTISLAPALGRAVAGATAHVAAIVAETAAQARRLAVGVAMAANISLQATVAAAATGAVRALTAAWAMFLGLGIMAFVGGIAAALTYVNGNLRTVEQSTLALKNANNNTISVLQQVATQQKSYGQNVDNTNKALDSLLGITSQTNRMADAASAAALRRAEAERELTVALLTRQAAELRTEAAGMRRSAGINQIGAAASKWSGDAARFIPGLDASKDYDESIRKSREASAQYRQSTQLDRTATTLTRLAGEVGRGSVSPIATVSPTATGGSDKKTGGGGKSEAERQAERYAEVLADLTAAQNEVGKSARDLAALNALQAAGFKRDLTLTDEKATKIMGLARRVYDLTKAEELSKESLEAARQAQQDLVAEIGGAAGEYQASTNEINRSVDARLAEARASGESADAIARVVQNLENERRARQAVADAQRQRQTSEFELSLKRDGEDANVNLLGTRDSDAAAREAGKLQILRAQEDALDAASRMYAANSVEFTNAKARIDATMKTQMEAMGRADGLERAQNLYKDMKDGLTTMFTGTEDEKKAYFIDLIAQLTQAWVLSKLFGTSMKDAFTGFSGGGASGGLLGSILGAKGGFGAALGGAGGGGGWGSAVGGILSLFGKSGGGPMMGNTPYLVGEQGPELFVPPQNGSLVKNSSLGGSVYNINGGGVNVTINSGGGGINAGALADDIARKNQRGMEAVARKVEARKGR